MTVSDTPGRSTWKCVYDQGPQHRGTGHIEPRGNLFTQVVDSLILKIKILISFLVDFPM